MKNFENPDIKITMLADVSIINGSNNEFALIERIPSLQEAAQIDE